MYDVCVYSVSMPTIISKGGHSVHHITKISNVTFSKNSIIWDSKIKNQYIKMKNGTKIFVTAIDNRGCSGTPGEFVIITTEKNKITIKLLITVIIYNIKKVVKIYRRFQCVYVIQNKI